eukprot:Nitzschia sp. Nitz4//scaffold141_size107518//50098//51372//NITZ4_004277-RA/size107518-processed-gene-0.111-mRNA-1//-1//CDS//3329536291//8091//frame0
MSYNTSGPSEIPDIHDIESGGPARFRLNTEDDMEPIPTLPHFDSNESNTPNLASEPPSVAANTQLSDPAVARMTTLEFLWRRHVRTQTNNPTIHAMLDRLLLIILFVASFVEEPLNLLLQRVTQTPNTQKREMKPKRKPVSRGTVPTPLGIVSYISCQGTNPTKTPILCFHSDGRSSDEFLEILPLLAETGRRVVAIDSYGYGWSENPGRPCKIDDIADALIHVAEKVLIQNFVCLGVSLGSSIAVSLASRHPKRVLGCICVNMLYHPPSNSTGENSNLSDVTLANDPFALNGDGSFLIDLHNKHKNAEPELRVRCIQSELSHMINLRRAREDGVNIESEKKFDLESAARRVKCPILCLSGEMALANLDARKMCGTQRFDSACRLLPQCEVTTLTGPRSSVHLLNQAAKEVSSLLVHFFEKHGL